MDSVKCGKDSAWQHVTRSAHYIVHMILACFDIYIQKRLPDPPCSVCSKHLAKLPFSLSSVKYYFGIADCRCNVEKANVIARSLLIPYYGHSEDPWQEAGRSMLAPAVQAACTNIGCPFHSTILLRPCWHSSTSRFFERISDVLGNCRDKPLPLHKYL